jgi:hypothetical protein
MIEKIENDLEFNQCTTLTLDFSFSQFQERWEGIILSLIEKKINPCSKLVISKCVSRKRQCLAKTFLKILSQNFLEEIVLEFVSFTSSSWRALSPIFKKATRLQKFTLVSGYNETCLDVVNAILSVNNAPNIYSLSINTGREYNHPVVYFHKINFSGFENLTELALNFYRKEHIEYLPELPKIPSLEKLFIQQYDYYDYGLPSIDYGEITSLFVDELTRSRIVSFVSRANSFNCSFTPDLLEKVLSKCEYLEEFSMDRFPHWKGGEFLNALMRGMALNSRISILRLPQLKEVYSFDNVEKLYKVLFSHPTLHRFEQILFPRNDNFLALETMDDFLFLRNVIINLFIETGNTNIVEFCYLLVNRSFLPDIFIHSRLRFNQINFENRCTTLSRLLLPSLNFFE